MTRLFESRHFSIAMVLATRYLIARLRYSPHASLRSAPHRFASLIQDTDTRKITRHTYSSSQHIATSHAGKLALARQADKLVLARPVLTLVLGAAIDKAATAAAQRQFAFALATLRTCLFLELLAPHFHLPVMSTSAVSPFRSFVQTPIFSVSPSSFSLWRI